MATAQPKVLKLVRSTDQTINNATDTAIAWSSAAVNTGASSWWASGAANNIVMPYAGLYLLTFEFCWAATSSAGLRSAHLNVTTTISDANKVAGTSYDPVSTGEDSAYGSFGTVIDVASAGDTYVMTVFQNRGGTLALDNGRFGLVPAATLSLTYLES